MLCKLENNLDDLRLDYYKVLKEENVETSENELNEINEELMKHKLSLNHFLNIKQNKSSDIITVNNSNNNQKLSIKLPLSNEIIL